MFMEELIIKMIEDGLAKANMADTTLRYDNHYQEVSTEHWVKKTTKTLVEDEDLINDLYEYCKGKWTLGFIDIDEETGDVIHDLSHSLTKGNVRVLVANKYTIHAVLNKVIDNSYELDWHDGSRWENDYNPDGAYYSIRSHSFSDVITEFIKDNPNKVKFSIKEVWIKE